CIPTEVTAACRRHLAGHQRAERGCRGAPDCMTRPLSASALQRHLARYPYIYGWRPDCTSGPRAYPVDSTSSNCWEVVDPLSAQVEERLEGCRRRLCVPRFFEH